jgi:8-amino-7-oxononanoate synthase
LRERLWANVDRLYQGLLKMGYHLSAAPSPVISIRVEVLTEALSMWNALLEYGVYVNLVLPPASPDGAPLLRCSVSAAHTFEQIDTIVSAFAAARES